MKLPQLEDIKEYIEQSRVYTTQLHKYLNLHHSGENEKAMAFFPTIPKQPALYHEVWQFRSLGVGCVCFYVYKDPPWQYAHTPIPVRSILIRCVYGHSSPLKLTPSNVLRIVRFVVLHSSAFDKAFPFAECGGITVYLTAPPKAKNAPFRTHQGKIYPAP